MDKLSSLQDPFLEDLLKKLSHKGFRLADIDGWRTGFGKTKYCKITLEYPSYIEQCFKCKLIYEKERIRFECASSLKIKHMLCYHLKETLNQICSFTEEGVGVFRLDS